MHEQLRSTETEAAEAAGDQVRVLAKLGKPVETVYTLELDEDISFWMVSVGCVVLLYLIIAFIVEGVPSELK